MFGDLYEIGFILNLADQFSGPLGLAGKNLNKFEKHLVSVHRSSQKMLTAGMGMTMFGQAMLEPLAQATEQVANFQHALVGVQKTTGLEGDSLQIFNGGSGDEIGKLAEELMKLGRTIPLSHVALAEIAETAGQLGIEGVNNIVRFTDVTARMAAVSDLSANEAAEAFAQIKNVFKLDISKDLEGLGSVINELSNSSPAKAGFIVNALQRIGQATQSLKVDHVAALGATMADIGIKAEVGGTALTQAFSKMQTDSSKFADLLGLGEDQWKQAVQQDSIGAFKQVMSLIDHAKDTEKASLIKDMFGADAGMLTTIQKMAGAQNILNKHLKTAAEQMKQQTSLQNEFQASQQSLIAQKQLLANIQAELSMNLAGLFMPAMMTMMGVLREMTAGMIGWAKEYPTLTKWVTGVTVAIGGLILVSGILLGTLGALGLAYSSGVAVLIKMKTAIAGLTVVKWLLNAALWASPLVLIALKFAFIAAAIVAVGVVIGSLIFGWERFSEILRNTPFAFIADGIDWVIEKLASLWSLFTSENQMETQEEKILKTQVAQAGAGEELKSLQDEALKPKPPAASALTSSDFKQVEAKQAFEIYVSSPLEMNFYGRDKQEVEREFQGIQSEFTLKMEDAMEAVFAAILKRQVGVAP